MIITFCGHSDYCETEEDRQALLSYLAARVGDAPVDFFLGGYGQFDEFAYRCCKQYQAEHGAARLLFVTPYNTPSYQRTHLEDVKARYDDIIYPPLESVPPRYAILHRNRYMVEQADVVIAYITHTKGGAYQTYRHAVRREKEIYCLAKSVSP